MNTAFQAQQLSEINREHKAAVAKLKSEGVIAVIGYCHYEGMHTNLCTVVSTGKCGPSKCVKGNDPKAALIEYAKAYFGGGVLRRDSVTKNDDGSVAVSFKVLPRA